MTNANMFEEQQVDDGDEFFEAVDHVSAGGQRLPYLVEGLYVLQIDKVVFLVTRPPQRQPLYIVECTIIESNNEDRPAGMQVSWCTKLNNDMGPVNMKRFVGAAMGFGIVEDIDRNVDSKSCKISTTSLQPFTGCQVYCQVTNIITKVEKKPFTEHKFSPIQGYSWNDLNPEPAAEDQVA